ncbi:MAG: hypothetical protein IRZ04_13460 [Rhodospirillales bacterium]|nr:hypothetical protein [Rhodospirillales bacterium]
MFRQGAKGPEVLMGRRGAGARFMAGQHVFPGGAVQRSDARRWVGEEENGFEGTVRALARAAVRETFEETGILVGRRAEGAASSFAPAGCLDPVEAAYRERRLTPALGALRLIARAITPTRSRIRFHAHFFLVDERHCIGDPCSGEELEEVRFYPTRDGLPEPIADVTQFVLRRALAIIDGSAPEGVPLYSYVGGMPRIRWG